MLESIAIALRDDWIRLGYALSVFFVLTLPIAVLAFWYHREIRKTEGGRRLMRDNESYPSINRTPGGLLRNLRGAGGMARGIASGAYGDHARSVQNRMYRGVIIWVLAVALVAGVPILAESLYPDPARTTSPSRVIAR